MQEVLSSPFDQAAARPLLGEPAKKRWSLFPRKSKASNKAPLNLDYRDHTKEQIHTILFDETETTWDEDDESVLEQQQQQVLATDRGSPRSVCQWSSLELQDLSPSNYSTVGDLEQGWLIATESVQSMSHQLGPCYEAAKERVQKELVWIALFIVLVCGWFWFVGTSGGAEYSSSSP